MLESLICSKTLLCRYIYNILLLGKRKNSKTNFTVVYLLIFVLELFYHLMVL